jgi:hypothetical protein
MVTHPTLDRRLRQAATRLRHLQSAAQDAQMAPNCDRDQKITHLEPNSSPDITMLARLPHHTGEYCRWRKE